MKRLLFSYFNWITYIVIIQLEYIVEKKNYDNIKMYIYNWHNWLKLINGQVNVAAGTQQRRGFCKVLYNSLRELSVRFSIRYKLYNRF